MKFPQAIIRLESPAECRHQRRFVCDCGGGISPDESESDEVDFKVKVRGCSNGCMLVDFTIRPFRCLVCDANLEAVTNLYTYEFRPPLVDVPEEVTIPGLTRLECPNGCAPEYTE